MDVMDSRVLTILFYSEMFKNVFALSANLGHAQYGWFARRCCQCVYHEPTSSQVARTH